ncbi:hypothetical protein CRUP_013556 [Coryphaenoides rupestris]|nr:hypothetical protein CRUP_013556 [Coryphaenoides rupestris]
MAQSCLKCLKYIMCAVNFLCFISGVSVVGFGIYLIRFQMSSLIPSLGNVSVGNLLLISGIIITCISFLGFIGALKENRCFLLTFFILLLILMLMELSVACLLLFYEKEIGTQLNEELSQGLKNTKANSNSSSTLSSDWDLVQSMGCLAALKAWFENNFLTTGIAVIILCVIEVLGMCFSMTLFCHISRSGLGYKL